MIVYHQAFDLYHSVYRMIQLLTLSDRQDYVEVDRLRIWDFYLLFPEKVYSIKLKRDEQDIRGLRQQYIRKVDNPYETIIDNRKMFEKIKPYQITAIKSLASYGVIDKELLSENRVRLMSKELLTKFTSRFEPLSPREKNIVKIMTLFFSQMSLYGPMGLKDRTQLLETKYDA